MDNPQPADADLYYAFANPRASRAKIAAMSQKSATRMVAYQRNNNVTAEMRDMPLSNAMIAEAVVRFAQSESPIEESQSPIAQRHREEPPGKQLETVQLAAVLVGVGSAVFACLCWFFASLPPGITDLAQPFVDGGKALAVAGLSVAYLVTVWRLIKGRRKLTVGRVAELLIVVGVPIVMLWLALALTGTPSNGTEFRLQRIIGRGDLNSANLSGYHLKGINLSGRDLHGTDLSGTDLSGANLSNADLSNANLSDADLSRANLDWADLRGANLKGADVRGAKVGFAVLSGATVDDTTKIDGKWRLVWEIATKGGRERNLARTDLSGANLQGADLSMANLSGADLSNIKLHRADLSSANLMEADLSGASLDSADLSGANLSGTILNQAYLDDANLSGADLTRADLSEANLFGTDLRGADLSGADMSKIYLSGAKLDDSTRIADKWRLVWEIATGKGRERNLAEADLSWADLRGADLSLAILSKANLSNTDVRGADLRGADLRGANLRGANLSMTDLRGANLRGADLTGAVYFINAIQSGTDLTGTIMPDGTVHE